MADVKHQFVFGRVKDVVEGHGGFHESEVRAYVSAVLAYTVQHCLTCLVGNYFERFDVQLFQVSRRLYFFDIHSVCFFSWSFLVLCLRSLRLIICCKVTPILQLWPYFKMRY